jgi:2-polyprenyl-3-methyl-5-hydroxy-6-metoxy-1,4-benzoquinol methylase
MKVIDVGCGPGIYVKELIDAGIDATGVDIDPACVKYFEEDKYKNNIYIQDILKRQYIWKDKEFDISLCLEVAEHINNNRGEELVNLLCRISKTVFFSAAQPGQGGHGHINCQPKEYWIELFAKNNYVLDNEHTDDLVDYFKNSERYTEQDQIDHPHFLGWLTQNIMIFKSYGDVCYQGIIEQETPQAKRLAKYIRGLCQTYPETPNI